MTTWVLLRGLTREAGHWGDVGSRLAARLDPGDTVVAADLAGNGSLHAHRSPASVPALSDACREDLRRRGLRPPYLLVAMSLGAMVALAWCEAAPEELAGCVLINTSLRGLSPFWQRLAPRNYLPLAGLMRPGLSALEREQRVLQLTSSEPARHEGAADRWAAMARRHPVSPGNAWRQLLAAARYRPPPARPGVALLVLASANDRLVSPRCSKRLAERWALPLKMHPDAGHDLPLDAPEWVLDQIMDWRAATAGPARPPPARRPP